jgi:membrane protease YdiL (CAAX protease family)
MTVVAQERRIWNEAAFVAVVLATLSAALAVEWTAAGMIGVHRQDFNTTQLVIALLARESAALLMLDFLAKRYLRITWADLGLERVRWGQVAFGAVLGVLMIVINSVLLAGLDLRAEASIMRSAAAGTLPWQLALVALIGVYSPVVQEIVFRGLLLQGLLQRMPAWAAIGVSAAIFALVHATGGAGAVINAFTFGILAGVLFARFRSLTAPIAAHVAGNSFATLYILWALHRAGPFAELGR